MSGKKQYRLLMIDDDASLNQLLTEYFEGFGHKLATATTAAAGRYLLRRDDPDLLILDVMLPQGHPRRQRHPDPDADRTR
jgi:DNA-binding response OmpR family regulator